MTDLIDFERLRTEDNIKLFVAATQVRAGNLRLFETEGFPLMRYWPRVLYRHLSSTQGTGSSPRSCASVD